MFYVYISLFFIIQGHGRMRDWGLLGLWRHIVGSDRQIRATLALHSISYQHSDGCYHLLHLVNKVNLRWDFSVLHSKRSRIFYKNCQCYGFNSFCFHWISYWSKNPWLLLEWSHSDLKLIWKIWKDLDFGIVINFWKLH